MKPELKESISRILMIVFGLMLLAVSTFATPAGTLVPLFACLAFVPIAALLLNVDKHRKLICVELILALVFITIDHVAGQKRKEEQLNSCYKEINELETKLKKYEPAEQIN